MALGKLIKLNSVLIVFLIFSLLGNNSGVAASTAHQINETEIDISNGYTSEPQVMQWKEEIFFQFEITEPADYTFELLNIEGTMFYFSFNVLHEGAAGLNLRDVGDADDLVKEGDTVNDESLPVGSHVELDVLRYLQITELGNYTLSFNNEHEHPSDPVNFQFKFTLGLSGVEEFGTAAEAVEDDAPGFGLGFTIVAVFSIVLVRQKFLGSKPS